MSVTPDNDDNVGQQQQKTSKQLAMATDIDAGKQQTQWMTTGDNNNNDGQMNNDNFDN